MSDCCVGDRCISDCCVGDRCVGDRCVSNGRVRDSRRSVGLGDSDSFRLPDRLL